MIPLPIPNLTPETPWTWRDFERESQAALEPFEPDSVGLMTFCLQELDNAPSDDSPVWPDAPPHTHWIACYAVKGSSEGWYVHVDLIRSDDLDRRILVLLAKFWRLEHALKAVEALTRIVWAHQW